MMFVRVDKLLWVLLGYLLIEFGRNLSLLLFSLGDDDLISLLLPVVKTHLLFRHITILNQITH